MDESCVFAEPNEGMQRPLPLPKGLDSDQRPVLETPESRLLEAHERADAHDSHPR